MIGFGDYGKRTNTMTFLNDKRLIKIDPSVQGFFDQVLFFDGKEMQSDICSFICAVKEVRDKKINAFWCAKTDPSLSPTGEIIFSESQRPPYMVERIDKMLLKVLGMPKVEGRSWNLGTPYQYYVFLVWLVNEMIKSNQYNAYDAVQIVAGNSDAMKPTDELGNFLEPKAGAGKKEICGVYDLANTGKLLRDANGMNNGVWLTSSAYEGGAIAEIIYYDEIDELVEENGEVVEVCVPWLVIE